MASMAEVIVDTPIENREERVAFVAKVYRLLNHVGDYLTFDFNIVAAGSKRRESVRASHGRQRCSLFWTSSLAYP